MTSFDTNVSDYTLSELMAIVNLSDLDPTDILKATNKYIQQYKTSDPTLSIFFQEVQSQLLQYSQGLLEDTEAIYSVGQKQNDDRYHNEYLEQSDKGQTSKITQRKQKIQVYGNQHNPMTREQLGINDTYSVPVKQDSLNPNLKNTIERFVNLDSQFRQSGGVNTETTSTNYTLDLSDRLTNTIELKLYSYQIPNTWYVIDTFYRNTCFWINNSIHNIPISVESGNYTQTQLVDALNTSFQNAGFYSNEPIVSYNSLNGKLTIALFGASYINRETDEIEFIVSATTKIIFYDFTATLLCENTCTNNHFFNQTLGWIMGFRVPSTLVSDTGNTGSAIVDLNGTKYLILVLDDYNQNRVNNSLVSITQITGTLKMPNYYSPDLTYVCLSAGNSNLSSLENGTNQNNGLLIAEKYNNDYAKTQIIVPSAPRTLTQSQIYTINEINKSKGSLTNARPKAPTSSDIMAIIPLKGGGASIPTGTLLAEFSGSLQDNVRTYFGPVNIDRMAVKLLDDKGNVLNLNGCDWCFTLIATCLYQY